MLMLLLSSLTSCATSKEPPPLMTKGIDWDDWVGHEGGVCLSNENAKDYLHWKNHK